MSLMDKWSEAVSTITVKHLDPTCYPVLHVIGVDADPELFVAVRQARDTRDQEQRFGQLNISTVRLKCWPGMRLAHMWIAASWANYLCHEALELVAVAGVRPLDPHGEGYVYDMNLRKGYPHELTFGTLFETLCLVMPPQVAEKLMSEELKR